MMRTIRFGIIGCGVMGREFATAVLRWPQLVAMPVRPQIVAVCNRSLSPERIGWFTGHYPSIRQVTTDYRELLDDPEIDAVYIAVPHNLHERLYCDAIEAGKHLMGEKPFGIDERANGAILACARRHPEVLVRCASQYPFFPGVQRIGRMIEGKTFGRILEVNSGVLLSHDLDPNKPMTWKQTLEQGGVYGCLGNLGPHACFPAFRAGWIPRDVRAILSDVFSRRPDRRGRIVPCPTWDNATLLCEAEDVRTGVRFPHTLKFQRVSPGQGCTWYLEILGTRACARFSTREAGYLDLLEYTGKEQLWKRVETGYEGIYDTYVPHIYQFGQADAMLQMWAAFVGELDGHVPAGLFARCVMPDETALSHRLFTAALSSARKGTTEAVLSDRELGQEGTVLHGRDGVLSL